MLLAIDIGNSTIKVAGFRGADGGEAPLWVRAVATRPTTTPDEFEVLVDGLLRLEDLTFADLTGAVAVSVVPDLTAALEAVARRRLRAGRLLLATSATLPLPVRVDHPGEVGADRLVDAYAAYHLYGGPAVVADVGTAITVDAVGRDGAFLGGAIAAGPALGLRALAEHTAKLPRVALTLPSRTIGRDTVSALQAGAAFGWHDLVDGLTARVRRELAELEGIAEDSVRVVIAGGFAATAWGASLRADAFDEHLTLKGLARFHAGVIGLPAESVR